MLWRPLEFDKDDQRRGATRRGSGARLAPELLYHTPSAQMGGTMFFDEMSLFQGRMDRFEFELKAGSRRSARHDNYRMQPLRPTWPSCSARITSIRKRWRRVAPRVGGGSYAAARRAPHGLEERFIDEDTCGHRLRGRATEKLFRVMFSNGAVNYAQGGFLMHALSMQSYDVSRGQYTALQAQLAEGSYVQRCALLARWPAPSNTTQRGVR